MRIFYFVGSRPQTGQDGKAMAITMQSMDSREYMKKLKTSKTLMYQPNFDEEVDPEFLKSK